MALFSNIKPALTNYAKKPLQASLITNDRNKIKFKIYFNIYFKRFAM